MENGTIRKEKELTFDSYSLDIDSLSWPLALLKTNPPQDFRIELWNLEVGECLKSKIAYVSSYHYKNTAILADDALIPGGFRIVKMNASSQLVQVIHGLEENFSNPTLGDMTYCHVDQSRIVKLMGEEKDVILILDFWPTSM